MSIGNSGGASAPRLAQQQDSASQGQTGKQPSADNKPEIGSGKAEIALAPDVPAIVTSRTETQTQLDQQRADADLQAQQDMAFYALLMVVATVATVLVTAIGVWFVKRTLDATLRAVEDTGLATIEMQKANELTVKAQKDAQSAQERIQMNAEAQIRAWIYVENVTIASLPNGDRQFDSALIDLKNVGNSPAFVTSYCIRFNLVRREEGKFVKIDLTSVEATVNIPIPSNTMPVRLPMARSETDIFEHTGEATDWSVQIDGFVIYKDVFDHERKTNFYFGTESSFWEAYPAEPYRCYTMPSMNQMT